MHEAGDDDCSVGVEGHEESDQGAAEAGQPRVAAADVYAGQAV